MGPRESIIVLITAADRGIQLFSQFHGFGNSTADNNTGTIQDDREFGLGQQPCGLFNGIITTGRAFKFNNGRQFNINHLSPEITRNVDLRRGRGTLGLEDNAVERLGNPARVTDFFLIGNHVLEEGHLLDFLKTALTDGLVGGLRGHQQQRGVVPVRCLHRRDKVGNAGAVLGHHHGHLARGTGVTVCHHASVAFMRRIPEMNTRGGEQIRNRHHGRTDNTKRMFDTMHLKNFDKGLFGRHFHGGNPPATTVII